MVSPINTLKQTSAFFIFSSICSAAQAYTNFSTLDLEPTLTIKSLYEVKIMVDEAVLHYGGKPVCHSPPPGAQSRSSCSGGGSGASAQSSTGSFKLTAPPVYGSSKGGLGASGGDDGKKPPERQSDTKTRPLDADEMQMKQRSLAFWARVRTAKFNLAEVLTTEQWPAAISLQEYLQQHIAAGLAFSQIHFPQQTANTAQNSATPVQTNWFTYELVSHIGIPALNSMVISWPLIGFNVDNVHPERDLNFAIDNFIVDFTDTHNLAAHIAAFLVKHFKGEEGVKKLWELIHAFRQHLGWPVV